MSTRGFSAVSRCTATATGTPWRSSCSLEALPRSKPTLKTAWRKRKLPTISSRYVRSHPARITQPVRVAVMEGAMSRSAVAAVVERPLSSFQACDHPVTVRTVNSGSRKSCHRRCRSTRRSNSLSRDGSITASSKKSALVFRCGGRWVRHATATSPTAKTNTKWRAYSLQIKLVSASSRRACALLMLPPKRLAATFDEEPGRRSE